MRLKGTQVSEYFIGLMQNIMLDTYFFENGRKFVVIWAVAYIACSEGADILLLHTGEEPIQLLKEVFAVSVSQRNTEAEVHDSLYTYREGRRDYSKDSFC